MLSQDQKIWTVATWISFKRFLLTLKRNKVQEYKARFCYIVCAMLRTSKSLLNKNLHQDQKSWGYEETRGTLQQHFCTDYLAGTTLPCVQGAAATHLKGLSGPTLAPSSWNFQLVWAVAQIPLEVGSKAQEVPFRLLGRSTYTLLQDSSVWVYVTAWGLMQLLFKLSGPLSKM